VCACATRRQFFRIRRKMTKKLQLYAFQAKRCKTMLERNTTSRYRENIAWSKVEVLRYSARYKLVSWSLTSLFSTNMAISETSARYKANTLCIKNATDVAHYNFNARQPILAIFGRDVAERVCYRIVALLLSHLS